jgi:hypothetical protein
MPPIPHINPLIRPAFTLGVRANVQPKFKSSIPIGAKVEISLKSFILGVKRLK